MIIQKWVKIEGIYHVMIIICKLSFKLESPAKIFSPPASRKCPLTILTSHPHRARLLVKVFQGYMALSKSHLLKFRSTINFNRRQLNENMDEFMVIKIPISKFLTHHMQSKITLLTWPNNLLKVIQRQNSQTLIHSRWTI